jgi:drug/metabolite transporter (DMT)-like permease
VPKGTIPALLATLLGAALVITVNPLQTFSPIGSHDVLGLLLATASSILMAGLVVVTSYITQDGSNAVTLYLQQTFALSMTYLVLSLISGESWMPFLHLDWQSIGYLLIFFVVVFMGGGLTVLAISKVNSTLFSMLLSLRLIVVFISGWLILDERLKTPYQFAGAVLVMITITLFLERQNAGEHFPT